MLFGFMMLKLDWTNSKCNCVVLIHVRNSFASNAHSPGLRKCQHSFYIGEGLFRVFSFYNFSVVILQEKKKDFILLLLGTNAFGKDWVAWQAKGLERKVSVPRLKQSPWQPVIKAPAVSFARHFHSGRPFQPR